jgi:putative hemolysin
MESGSSSGQLFASIGLVLFFIAVAALFVAAEIALISLRESQVKHMQGRRGAKVAALIKNPNRFLAAAQVGVTFCGFLSAALGSEKLGTQFVVPALERWGMSHSSAVITSLLSVTTVIAYISLVFGELVPKRLAIYRTEQIALASAGIIDLLAKVFRPVIWLLSRSTDAVVKLFGVKPSESRKEITEAELVDLVAGHSALSAEERDIVEEVFNSGDMLIHEVMIPRVEVDFVDVGTTIAEAMQIANKSSHSRYPVTRGNSDEVIGFFHVRDLLKLASSGESKQLLDLIRPVLFLPGTKGVLPALTEMRGKRQHMAIVLDEYGGTDGIVTIEDLVECFIGDIHDEYDTMEEEVTEQPRTGDLEVDALISLEDLEDQTGVTLPEGPYETLGGFVMHSLGHLPKIHDVVHFEDVRITVLSIEGKRAGELLISKGAKS